MFKPILPQIPAEVLENLSPEARENFTAICDIVDFTLGGLGALCSDLLDPTNQNDSANTGKEFLSLQSALGSTLLIPAEALGLGLFNPQGFREKAAELGAVGRETLADLSRPASPLDSLPTINPN